MLVELMTAASVFLESSLVATAPKAEKESLASALKGIAVQFGSCSSRNPPILKQIESSAERPPGGRGCGSEEISQEKDTIATVLDFDRCLAGYFGLVRVAVDASALTPCGFAAVLSSSTLCLR